MQIGPGCFGYCSAVVTTHRKWAAGRDLRHFPYAGVYREGGVPIIGRILKVAAHVWEEDAKRQGWHRDWRGNNLADEFAGRARPALTAPPRPWVEERRARKKLLRELLASLQPDDLWHEMSSRRPTVARARAVAEPTGEDHLPVFVGGGWACSTCGTAARS